MYMKYVHRFLFVCLDVYKITICKTVTLFVLHVLHAHMFPSSFIRLLSNEIRFVSLRK